MRKIAVTAGVLLAAATAPWLVLFATNGAMGPTPRAFDRDRCTRHCHDHGCRHRPVLPEALTSDDGLFGDTVRALHAMGHATTLGPGLGYGAVNLVVFCLLWPALMLWLVGVVTWQRLRIAELRRRAP